MFCRNYLFRLNLSNISLIQVSIKLYQGYSFVFLMTVCSLYKAFGSKEILDSEGQFICPTHLENLRENIALQRGWRVSSNFISNFCSVRHDCVMAGWWCEVCSTRMWYMRSSLYFTGAVSCTLYCIKQMKSTGCHFHYCASIFHCNMMRIALNDTWVYQRMIVLVVPHPFFGIL